MSQEMSMEAIRSRLAGLQLYAVFMRPAERYNTQSEEGREFMRRHLQFQLSMEDKGILLAAGPLNGAGQAATLAGYRDVAPEAAAAIIDAGFLMDSTIAVLRLAHKGVFEQNKGMKFIVPHMGTFLLAGIDRVAGQRPAQVEGGQPVREYLQELYHDSIAANPAF